tara:strand:+ start:250 stop:1170 length:921 start_codon:yes stop_codon:yes gene_type:complete
MTRSQNISASANLSCFFAMVLWAAGFIAAEYLFETWGSLSMLSVRLVASMGFLLCWWGMTEDWFVILNSPWKEGIKVGAIGWGLGGILLLIGQQLSDPVTTTIVVAMMPIAAAVIELIWDGRSLTRRLIFGIILAITGGYLATGLSIEDGDYSFGVFLCLAAIFLFAWATRTTTRRFNRLTYTGQATITMAGGMFITLICHMIALMAGSPLAEVGDINSDNITALIVFALPSAAIAQLFWIWGAGKLGILLASFHMNAVPFYVMSLAVLLGTTEWRWIQAIGAGIIVIAVFVSQRGSRSNYQEKSE